MTQPAQPSFETTTESGSPAEVEETKQETTETAPPPAEGEDENGLPEWAKKSLTKARNEAGNYRTRLREVEAKLAGAKTPEEFESATAELKAANAKLERDLLVERVARTAKLPNELAELLQGSTEEELKAHAVKLQKFVTPEKESLGDLRGGLDPNDEDDFDPVKAAHAAKKFRY